jgi:hypothetical protein
MWKFGLWPRKSFSGNICFEYCGIGSLQCSIPVFTVTRIERNTPGMQKQDTPYIPQICSYSGAVIRINLAKILSIIERFL